MGNIVAIAVEKIQKYIFQKIDNSPQDKKTLQNIIAASNQVAENILDEINEEFNILPSKKDLILWISGKTVFRSDLSKKEITEKCKKLFEKIYRVYQGQIFLKYVTFEENSNCNMEILRRADRELKNPVNKSNILKNSHELLFQFTEVNKKPEQYIYKEKDKKWKDVFLKGMDDLAVQDERYDIGSSDGKIAIIKADINNLGRIMSSLGTYDLYKKISQLLEDKIKIDAFAEHIKNYSEKEKCDLQLKVLPFYIAGDDIFYATRIDSVFDTINVLRNMINNINTEIKEHTNQKVSIELSLAVGVVFVNNHQPIRYYRQLVEHELSIAKKKIKTEKSLQALVGISMAGNSFHIYKNGLGFGECDGFFRFTKEIDELKDMLQKQVFTNTELHNLLINLEVESKPEQKFYYTLYFLKPSLQKGEIVNDELYFKYYWLSHLIEESTGEKDQSEKGFDLKKIDNVLIPKIKLVLLFLREKYSNPLDEVEYQYIKSTNLVSKIRSVMFHKPLNYLLKSMNKKEYKERKKNNHDELINLFIRIKNIGKRLYLAVDFQVSIFFRAKTLIENGKKNEVPSLFEKYDEMIRSKIKSGEKNEMKNPHRISFDIKKFKKLYIESKGIQWLDTLILAFHYNQQRIIIKTVEKENNEKKKKNKYNRNKKNDSKNYKQSHRQNKKYNTQF